MKNPYLDAFKDAMISFKKATRMTLGAMAKESGFSAAFLSGLCHGKSTISPGHYLVIRRVMERRLASIKEGDAAYTRRPVVKAALANLDAAWRGYVLFRALERVAKSELRPAPTAAEVMAVMEVVTKGMRG